jgi:septal ring factor EnvC (AmiA/AmiB activator)
VSETEGVEMLAAERDRLAAELARERAANAEYRFWAESDRAAGARAVREADPGRAGHVPAVAAARVTRGWKTRDAFYRAGL